MAGTVAANTNGTEGGGRLPRRFGLSAKLFVLTILSVMIAEVFIYVPSIANFRLTWIKDRLAAAHTAALVLDAAPSGMVPESLAREFDVPCVMASEIDYDGTLDRSLVTITADGEILLDA